MLEIAIILAVFSILLSLFAMRAARLAKSAFREHLKHLHGKGKL